MPKWGGGYMHDLQLAPMEELVTLMREQLNKGGSVRFSPRGVSMLPMLRHGKDGVQLSPITGKLKKYDVALYRRDDGRYVLHRIVRTGDTYTCIGDNQYHCEKGVRHDQMIAVVTAFIRRGRHYTVDNMKYRIYCRLWHYSRFPRRVLRALKHRAKKLLKRG